MSFWIGFGGDARVSFSKSCMDDVQSNFHRNFANRFKILEENRCVSQTTISDSTRLFDRLTFNRFRIIEFHDDYNERK